MRAQDVRWGEFIREKERLLAETYYAGAVLTEQQEGERDMLFTLLQEIKEIRTTQEFNTTGLDVTTSLGMK